MMLKQFDFKFLTVAWRQRQWFESNENIAGCFSCRL